MHRLLMFLAVFAVAILPALTVAQEASPTATPYPPIEGVIAEAQREYQVSGLRLIGTAALSFVVFEFDTAENDEAAMPVVVQRLTEGAGLGELDPTSDPSFRESTLAYTGKLEQGDYAFDVALLVVRDGRFVHASVGVGLAADPLSDLLKIADQAFADPRNGTTTPDPEELVDRLPSLENLPPGFVLQDEST